MTRRDLTIIELKRASNAEARLAVVAQVVSCAALLDHMAYDDLEQRILGDHRRARNLTSLAVAGRAAAQGQGGPGRHHLVSGPLPAPPRPPPSVGAGGGDVGSLPGPHRAIRRYSRHYEDFQADES